MGCLPRDLGVEPFARLRLHGVVLKDGERMSKSRGTVVNPDEYVARYGADVLRVYLLFMGPLSVAGTFATMASTASSAGCRTSGG